MDLMSLTAVELGKKIQAKEVLSLIHISEPTRRS
mgnify:CR=1 FL=1